MRPNRMSNLSGYIKYCLTRYKYIYDYSWKKTTSTEVVYNCPWHGVQKQDAMRHMKGVGCTLCMAEAPKTYKDFLERARKVHGKRYKFPKSVGGFTLQSRITFECPDHGEVTKAAYDILNGKGCQYCAKGMLSKKQFVIRAIRKHGEAFDYSKVPDGVLKGKLKIKCKRHGFFTQYAQSHLDGELACTDCVYEKRNPDKNYFFLYLFLCYKGNKYFFKGGLANDVERRGKEHARALAKGWNIKLLKAWKIDSKKGAFSTEYYVLSNLPGKPVSKTIMTVGHTETKYVKLKPATMVKKMDSLIREYLKKSRRHINKSQKYS